MKRHHIQRSPSPSFKLDDEDDSYEPYVPVAQRRRQKMAKLYVEKQQKEDLDDNEDAQREEELRKEKARMERTLLIEAQEVHSKKAVEGMFYMLDSSYQVIHLFRDLKKTASEKAEEADAEILEAIKSRRKLASDMELAKGIEYTESLKTRWATTIYSWTCAWHHLSWRPPQYIRDRTPEQHQKVRDKYHILVDGEDIPPPIEHFVVSRFI